MTHEQEYHLRNYLDASRVTRIEFPVDGDKLRIVSEVGGYQYTDVIDADGRTTVESTSPHDVNRPGYWEATYAQLAWDEED